MQSPSAWAEMPPRVALIIAGSCIVPAVLDSLQMYLRGVSGLSEPQSWGEIISSGSEWLIFGALTPLAFYLGRRFPLRRPQLGRAIAVHTVAALLLCVLWAVGGATMVWALSLNRGTRTRESYLLGWFLTSLPWSVILYFAVLGCVQAFGYFVEARDREAQATRLAALVAESRLETLRLQLQPHFLFNSLNAITVLVRDQDTKNATRMLELLGELLHQVLRTDARHEVPLAEELQLLERYLAIEQVRFSDRLVTRIDASSDLLDAAVPKFALQPLVENAIRHGIAKRSASGRVEIVAKRDGDDVVVSVTDDGAGLEEGDESWGVGLSNTRERLSALYGERAALTLSPAPGGGTQAIMRLPYRKLVSA